MVYDLRTIKTPRVAGPMLRILALSLENPISNMLLIPKLLKEAGIERFRTLMVEEPPTYWPEHEAEPLSEPLEPPDLNTVVSPPDVEGFRFNGSDDFATAYRDKRTTPLEVAQRLIDAIEDTEYHTPPLRALVAWKRDEILKAAQEATARFEKGTPLGVLDGVPVAVKDEVDQVPYPTTVGTRFLGRSAAHQDATTVARLRAGGALLIGKANMHEIGIGVTGFNPHHGTARNPYHLHHHTGGSSSGSASSVAAGLCPLALGADGGGSIRIPSSLCGLVGLKATFGRVSEHGAAPLCWSVAHIGPMGATWRDVAIGYATMAGIDPLDPRTKNQPPVQSITTAPENLTGLTLGVFKPWFEHAHTDVLSANERALDYLRDAGATVKEIEIPDLDAFRVAHVISIVSEMCTAMDRHYDAHLDDFGFDVRINMSLGRKITARDYIKAQRMRTRAMAVFARLFTEVDAIVTPTTARVAPPIPTDAFPHGESNLTMLSELMRFAPLPNLTGHPAISFPVGYNGQGLPIGMQVIGRPWQEHQLIQIAALMERHIPRKKPVLYYDLLNDKPTPYKP